MVIQFLLLLSEASFLITGYAKYLIYSDNCIIYANILNHISNLYTLRNTTYFVSIQQYPSLSLYNTLYVNPNLSLINEQYLINTSAALLFDYDPGITYSIVC